MTSLIARAAQQVKLAVAIHELLPPRASAVGARVKARNHRFRLLLHHAAARSHFYREKFRGIDLDTCEISDLPVLTKAEMMENLDAVFTDRQLRRSEIERFISMQPISVCFMKGST